MTTTYPTTFTLPPYAILDARTALLLLAVPDAPENVERLYQVAETSLRRTYGDLDRPGVSLGELRRAGFCADLRRMKVGEIADAAARLDDGAVS